MVKIKLKRFLAAMVFGLWAVGFVNLAQNVYSAIDPVLTEEERTERREDLYGLGHCAAPDPTSLEVPVEEIQEAYLDTQACVSDTSVANSIKSTNQMMSEVRESGGVKKPHEKQEKPDSSPCSKSDEKVLAEQARYDAQTQGLLEGKNGAETMANNSGSTAEFALISQNLQTCHELKLREMGQVGPSFNFYCEENPEECEASTSTSWFAPVAVVQASAGLRNFSTWHAERISEINQSLDQSQRIEKRARQERATFERYNYLHQAFKTLADKDQEIRAKNEVLMTGFRGENPGEGLVEKFDQGGISHTANSL